MRLRMTRVIVPVSTFLCIWLSTAALAYAQDCSKQLENLDSLRTKVKNDQDAIRRLNPRLTGDELDQWANAAEAERQRILKQAIQSAIKTLADGLLDAPKEVLKPMDIAGYHLPNGIGSLGTGQANAIIGRLQANGLNPNSVLGETLISGIRSLSQVSGKTGTAEYLQQLSKVGKSLKGLAEMGSAEGTLESLAAFLQLIANLTGKADFGLALTDALFQGAKNELDAYVISSAIANLSGTASSQLDAIKTLSAALENHVRAVQIAKADLNSCEKARRNGKTLPVSTGGVSIKNSSCGFAPICNNITVCADTNDPSWYTDGFVLAPNAQLITWNGINRGRCAQTFSLAQGKYEVNICGPSAHFYSPLVIDSFNPLKHRPNLSSTGTFFWQDRRSL